MSYDFWVGEILRSFDPGFFSGCSCVLVAFFAIAGDCFFEIWSPWRGGLRVVAESPPPLLLIAGAWATRGAFLGL